MHQVLSRFLRFLLLFYCSKIERDVNKPGHVTRFKMADNTCTIFSHSNLPAFVQKNSDRVNEWIESLQNLKENFSCNLFCHRNTQGNATDFRS